MIGLVLPENFITVKIAMLVHHDFEFPSFRTSQRDPLGKRGPGRKFIHDPDKLPGFIVNGVIAFLEVIKFLEHRYGYRNVVVFKTTDRVMVIKDN